MIKKLNSKMTPPLIIGLLVGAALTLLTQHVFVKSDIQKSKDAISAKYLNSNPGGCNETNHTTAQDNVKMFNKFLKVNKLNNRAVIRVCYADTLLAKTPSGDWVPTHVQMNLDTRVNPAWQKACLIQDITTADTVVRPENSSIDNFNLKACKALNQLNILNI